MSLQTAQTERETGVLTYQVNILRDRLLFQNGVLWDITQ